MSTTSPAPTEAEIKAFLLSVVPDGFQVLAYRENNYAGLPVDEITVYIDGTGSTDEAPALNAAKARFVSEFMPAHPGIRASHIKRNGYRVWWTHADGGQADSQRVGFKVRGDAR